jgi:hypothetical protein
MKRTILLVVLFSLPGEISLDTGRYMALPGYTWQYQTILTNFKQYLLILVAAGIIWYEQVIKYCCQYYTSIVMISSQYSTEGFVPIWYGHGMDSCNFQKSFNAYL